MAQDLKDLTEEILHDMETTNDCCKPIIEKLIYLADAQAQEMDRFFKAVGLNDEKISIDDAISI